MPLVSVVIPSFNHARFIGSAVRSVLGQSLSDLELIVVEDGSTDNSLEILGGFSDPRLKVYPQANAGAHAAINRGLELASGAYLSILNSDDLYHRERLEKLLALHRQHPQTGLIGSYIQVIDSEGAPLGVKHGYHDLEPWPLPEQEKSTRAGEDLRMVLLTENYWSTTSNFLFPRACLEQVGPFTPLRYAHDWDFALRVARSAPLLMVPEALLSYRIHRTNTIRENQAAMIFEICWILACHLPQATGTEWFQARGDGERFDQLVHSIYVFQCERILSLMLLQNLAANPAKARELLNPDNPLRASYLEFIRSRLAQDAQNGDGNRTSPKRGDSFLKNWRWLSRKAG